MFTIPSGTSVPKRLISALTALSVALTVLGACIPIPKAVSLSGSSFQGSPVPLAADEGIVILSVNDWASTDSMAACVRDAVAGSSRATRIVPLDQFRSAAGGIFATPDVLTGEETPYVLNVLTGEEIGDALRRARSAEFAALKLRYVFVVEGATVTSEIDKFGYPIVTVVGRWSADKRTDIQVTVWDAIDGRRLESIATSASGVEAITFVGLYSLWGYAPTESRACRDIAGKILRLTGP